MKELSRIKDRSEGDESRGLKIIGDALITLSEQQFLRLHWRCG